MLIPCLLELPAPVGAMENIVQRGDGFDHQKVTNRRSLRGGDFPLIHETKLGKELNGIFAGATGDALDPFLTGNGFQRHSHQRSKAFVLHGGMNGHKAD